MVATGITQALRDVIKESSQLQWTTATLFDELKKKGLPYTRRQVSMNVHTALTSMGIIESSGERFGHLVIYNVTGKPNSLRNTATDRNPLPEPEKEELKQNGRKAEQLLFEELQSSVEQLQKSIKELQDQEHVSLLTLGRAVERALVDKAVKINQLESRLREQDAKHAKIHSEDRGNIGGLQKRVLDLERENAQLREKLRRTEGITIGNKPINVRALTS